jgi:hypothetical protein
MAGALSFEIFGAIRAEIESHIISNDYCVWLLRRKVWSANLQGVRRLHGLDSRGRVDAQTSDSRR